MEKFGANKLKDIFDDKKSVDYYKRNESNNSFIAENEFHGNAINGENSYYNTICDYNNNNNNNKSDDKINSNNDNNGVNGKEEDDLFDEDLLKNDGFGSPMTVWSERETQFLKQLKEADKPLAKLKPGDQKKLFQIRDKYKTLRRIRNGNTKRLMEQFENLH